MATASKNAAPKKTGKKVPEKTQAAQVITLADIVASGANGMYVPESVFAPLVEAGLVEINTSMIDENGNVATRATQMGIESLDNGEKMIDNASSEATNADVGKTEKVKSMFKIEDNVPVPAVSGRGRGANLYPFDELQPGQSFFVPNSEDKPNAAKSLASTVSSATARYAVGTGEFETVTVKDYQTDANGERVKGEDGKFIVIGEHSEQREIKTETRKFAVRSVEGGARIWRTQ